MSNLSRQPSREASLLRGQRGDGDSAKKHQPPKTTSRSSSSSSSKNVTERVAVPSARRFTATPRHKAEDPQQALLKERLKKTIDEMEGRPSWPSRPPALGLKKTKSIAEITPTKCSAERRSQQQLQKEQLYSPVSVYATPRPTMDVAVMSPSRRLSDEERRRTDAAQKLYNAVVLSCWRRRRTQVAALADSLRRHQNQEQQLKLQIEVLTDLNASERELTKEANDKCHNKEAEAEMVRKENESLQKVTKVLEEEVEKSKLSIESLQDQLQNCKNCICTRDLELADSRVKLQDLQVQLEDMENIKITLSKQIAAKEEAYGSMRILLDKEIVKCELFVNEFARFSQDFDNLLRDNETLREELQLLRNPTWTQSAGVFGALSWGLVRAFFAAAFPKYSLLEQ